DPATCEKGAERPALDAPGDRRRLAVPARPGVSVLLQPQTLTGPTPASRRFSFPSSAWEREVTKLRFVAPMPWEGVISSAQAMPAKRSFGAVRSQAELGNEGKTMAVSSRALLGRAALEELQAERLRSLLAEAVPHNAFYARKFARAGVDARAV